MAVRRYFAAVLKHSLIKQRSFHSFISCSPDISGIIAGRRSFFVSTSIQNKYFTASRLPYSSSFSPSLVEDHPVDPIISPNWETNPSPNREHRNSALQNSTPNQLLPTSESDDSTTAATQGCLEPTDIYIPVKAFFISRRINLKGLQEEELFQETAPSRNHLILKWKDRPSGCPPITGKLDIQRMSTWSSTRYMVVFNYGAVVLFNFGESEEAECMDVIRQHCSEPCQEARNDDFDVVIRPSLQRWCEGGQDKVLLKKLDLDNMRIVASILGQSIALDHYGGKVDTLVNIFSDLNQKMEKTGTFTMKRKALFRVVATANTTLADVILRLGLLERSDAAWKDANYASLWEFLREEYELDERFESFDFKLEIIQHNVRFFLEVLQNRKSDTLEWIIIFLIAGEICVSLYQILQDGGVV